MLKKPKEDNLVNPVVSDIEKSENGLKISYANASPKELEVGDDNGIVEIKDTVDEQTEYETHTISETQNDGTENQVSKFILPNQTVTNVSGGWDDGRPILRKYVLSKSGNYTVITSKFSLLDLSRQSIRTSIAYEDVPSIISIEGSYLTSTGSYSFDLDIVHVPHEDRNYLPHIPYIDLYVNFAVVGYFMLGPQQLSFHYWGLNGEHCSNLAIRKVTQTKLNTQTSEES